MLAVPFSPRLRCLFALLCACGFLPSLKAQSSEADLKTRLIDKPLYLRGFWRNDKLHFDSNGQLKESSDNLAFTLCGFDLRTVQLKPDRLILEGRRVGLELADNQQKRISLDESMHIEITANPTGNYGSALDAIFADGLADLVPSLPFYWKSYAQKNFLSATATSPPPTQEEVPPKHIGGGISPPKLLHSADPKFNNVARSLKYGGQVIANLWIEPDGTISHLTVNRALGLGLDESALAAVQQYTFSPAIQNGKPIQVELHVVVNFMIR